MISFSACLILHQWNQWWNSRSIQEAIATIISAIVEIDWRRSFHGADVELRDALREVCKQLFPEIGALYGNPSYGAMS